MASSRFHIVIGGEPALEDLNPAEEAEREQRIAAAAAEKAAAEKAETDDNSVRDAVRATAASAEGLALTALTAAQVKSLLAVLLWKAGAVDKNGVVKPLAEWARR